MELLLPFLETQQLIQLGKKLKMKLLLENWREYLNEDLDAIVIPTREELVRYITRSPHQKIYLDNPKGTKKSFGRGKKN